MPKPTELGLLLGTEEPEESSVILEILGDVAVMGITGVLLAVHMIGGLGYKAYKFLSP